MDYEEINKSFKSMEGWEDDYHNWVKLGKESAQVDLAPNVTKLWKDSIDKERHRENVDSPKHYTAGKVEVIDIIEDAIEDAPTPKAGMLQAQVIKYILRMWLKENPRQDAQKAEWYLKRLIESLK